MFLLLYCLLYCLLNCLLAPKLRQQPGPGPAGSWAGPAWFKMLLGLGGEPGWWGGGGKGGEKGGHTLSVFLEKHINVSFSYKYALLFV